MHSEARTKMTGIRPMVGFDWPAIPKTIDSDTKLALSMTMSNLTYKNSSIYLFLYNFGAAYGHPSTVPAWYKGFDQILRYHS